MLWLNGLVLDDLLLKWGDKDECDDEFCILGVMVTDEGDDEKEGAEGIDFVETIGLPLTECALKLVCGDPGRGCVYPLVS